MVAAVCTLLMVLIVWWWIAAVAFDHLAIQFPSCKLWFSRGGPFKAKQYPADLCSLLQKKAINNFDIGSCVGGGGEGS